MNLGHLPGSTVPALRGKTPQVELKKQNGEFIFDVAGDDNIKYIYRPASGTLSDLQVVFNGGKAFAAMSNGGFAFVAPDGRALEPDNAELKAQLKSSRIEGKKLYTVWQWSYQGRFLAETALDLEVRNQSLAIEFSGGNGKVHAVKTGSVKGVENFKLNTIPYWVLRPCKGKDPMV